MTREEALQLVHEWTKSPNLIKHMLCVEAEMRALAKYFNEDEDLWGIAGLLHDADYEMFKDDAKKHPSKIFEELEKRNADPRIIQAIRAHAWGWNENSIEPVTKMDWAIFTADELSGFIVACALVTPDRKLTSVTVEKMKKKWKEKSFAAGVKRQDAEMCEEKLGIKLEDYMQICLTSIQNIAPDLGL